MADPVLDRVPFSTGSSWVPGPLWNPPRCPSVPDRVPFGTPDRVPFGTPNLSLELSTNFPTTGPRLCRGVLRFLQQQLHLDTGRSRSTPATQGQGVTNE